MCVVNRERELCGVCTYGWSSHVAEYGAWFPMLLVVTDEGKMSFVLSAVKCHFILSDVG